MQYHPQEDKINYKGTKEAEMRMTVRSKNYLAAVLGLQSQEEPLRVGRRWLHKKERHEGKELIRAGLTDAWLN